MRPVVLLLPLLLAGPAALAETVTVEADRDATLIEHPDGALANGSGPAMFAGHTAQAAGGIRRALVRFDVAGALPARAVIDRVTLRLTLMPSNVGARAIRLHRVLADWGEGASSATGGGGAPAQPGDATWIHTFWDTEYWAQPGGLFAGRVSAQQVVDDPGAYTWADTEHLAQDVRLWNAAPWMNFGWILIGDELSIQSSKNFASREAPDPSVRPMLEIDYHLPGELPEP